MFYNFPGLFRHVWYIGWYICISVNLAWCAQIWNVFSVSFFHPFILKAQAWNIVVVVLFVSLLLIPEQQEKWVISKFTVVDRSLHPLAKTMCIIADFSSSDFYSSHFLWCSESWIEVSEWSELNSIENMRTVLKNQVCAGKPADLVELHRFCQEKLLYSSVRGLPEACGISEYLW